MNKFILLLFCGLLSACHSQLSEPVLSPPASVTPATVTPLSPFQQQIQHIASASPRLYQQYTALYQTVDRWLKQGADSAQLKQFGLVMKPLSVNNSQNKTLFTGYYTPVLKGSMTAQGDFRYPLYALPKMRPLPSRAEVYAGIVSQDNVLAYTNSLLDNFMMQVQGSGYIDFDDGQAPVFFAFAGKNRYPYRSIGRVLLERGEIAKGNVSLQAIRQWTMHHSDRQIQALLEQNPSFVFFKPEKNALVVGASGVPLVANVAVAADPQLISPGSVLLAQVPLLDKNGKSTGQFEQAIFIALDVGSAIKGTHLDLYQGIGDNAGHQAGFYNHYGRVWIINRDAWLNPTMPAGK